MLNQPDLILFVSAPRDGTLDLWRHVTPQPDLNPCHRDDGSSTHAELVDDPVQDRGAHALNSESGDLAIVVDPRAMARVTGVRLNTR